MIQPTISLCMIVKDEEQHLERCLVSAQSFVNEIIIVDTGSQDKTKQIAQWFNAHIYDFPWSDDFAAARNASLEKASGDWVLVLDADEELVVTNSDFRDHLAENSEKLAYLLKLRNFDSGDQEFGSLFSRLFIRHPDLRYEGVYHEQLQYQGHSLKEGQVGLLPDLSIVHYGYEPELLLRKQKDRNIPMLERHREQGNLNLVLLHYLAYLYDTTNQPTKAEDCYTEIFDQLFLNLLSGEVPQDATNLGAILYSLISRFIDQAEYENARLLSQKGLEWCPNYPPLHFVAGQLLMNLELNLGAIPYFQQCLKLGKSESYYSTEPFLESFVGLFPAFHMGLAYQNQKQWQSAKTAYELALSFDSKYQPAQEHLAEIEHHIHSQTAID